LAGGASLIMNAVAPAIGEPMADRFGYRPVFLLAAVAALIAAVLARRLRVSDAPPGHAQAAVGPRAPSGGAPRWLPVYIVFAMAGLAFSVMFTFLAPFALAHGVHAIRAFFIAYTCAALAVRLLGGRMSDRLGHGSVAAGAILIYGCVIASTGWLGPRHLVLLGVGFGLAHGAAFPALMALLVSGTPPARRPRVLGIANGAMSVGISAVFPAGMLVKPLGYTTMFALAGGLTAAAAALIWNRPRTG
jgi:predicted MFS family arabinose efflux permease